jgi:putative intracellular protease/amidase
MRTASQRNHVPLQTESRPASSGITGPLRPEYANTEEEAAYLTKMVPFLVEDELKQLGGLYAKGPDWGAFIKVDGNLITGQNPASSAPGVCSILKLIQAKEALETVSR